MAPPKKLATQSLKPQSKYHNRRSCRRTFATELRRKGLSELDIAELGRWSSTEMVQRYSKAYTFQDAATRYEAIVRQERDISLYPPLYLVPYGASSR